MRRLVHGIMSALGVLLVVVGVPIVLTKAAAWPLPTALPDWENVYWSARQQHIPSTFVIKTLACVAWVAWAQLVWALVWEFAVNVPRTLRGQRALPAPWAFEAMSRAARGLVAPLLLLSALTTSSPAAAAPALAQLSSTAWFGPLTSPDSAATVVGPHAPAEPAPTWVVASGDTLWDVAVLCLGDGSRVDEILACNPGLRAASRLVPGEVLALPADATVAARRAPQADGEPATTASTDATYVVEPGDTLWEIAERELADPGRWPELFQANRGRTFADGRTLHDPDLIHPGWDLNVPSTAASPAAEPREHLPDPAQQLETAAQTGPVVEPPDAPITALPDRISPDRIEMATPRSSAHADAPTTTAAPPTEIAAADVRPVNRWSDVTVPGPSARSTSDASSRSRASEPAAAPASAAADTPALLTMERAAMLSAGVLLLLAVRRRQRLRTAPPGAKPPRPAATTAATERELRSIGSGERFARVDVAVRASAMTLIRHGHRPLAVLVAPDGSLELIATGDVEMAPPWSGADERWTLPATVPIELLAADARQVAAPTPTLVQLGCDGEREVYVDLEALGALQIDAPAACADAVVAALTTTLATSVLAEVTTLVGVAIEPSAFCEHRHYAEACDVADGLSAAVEAVGSTVATNSTTFELRARATGGETWEPAVLLVGSAAGEAVMPFVPPGVAVVSAAPITGPSAVLTPDGDTWVLRPAGIRLTPVGMTPEDLVAVDELLDVPVAEPGDALAESDERSDSVAADPPYALLVRLIGPVRVETAGGEPVQLGRSKTRELVAWLATHRERSTRTLARTALWEFDVRDATFANVVSEARRALARAVAPPEGDEWVARTLTEQLPLHELVRTDADVLTDALSAARLAAPDEAIARLRPAVELLAGVPFEGTAYLWPDAEGLTSHLVVLATSAAAELAAQCLAVGDIEGVFAATDRGLRVLPGHEELIGLRMQAHARAGDHAGVRHEWEAYSRTLVADPWSDGEPNPKLVALRTRLIGGAAT